MAIVSIRHRTVYRYRKPVSFGEHRMMFRPLESHDQRVLDSELIIGPLDHTLRQIHDVFGNSVAIALFEGQADTLSFDSRVRLEHTPTPGFTGDDGEALAYAGAVPFKYSPQDLPDLARSMTAHYPDPQGELKAWTQGFLKSKGRTALETLLTDITQAIHADFRYATRMEGFPQTPLQTLASKSGSCRDFAVLMMEAVRSLGLAARFASGYIYSSKTAGAPGARIGGGHTHAWVRVYLPVLGWMEFDPTNGIVGNTDLVRVAIARDPQQALPLHGTWSGDASDSLGMEVSVDVEVETAQPMQPHRRLRLASAG